MSRFLTPHCSLLIIFVIATLAAHMSKHSTSLRPTITISAKSKTMSNSKSGPMVPEYTEVAKKFLLREIGSEVVIEPFQIAMLRTDLLLWYYANRRLLPWRGDIMETTIRREVELEHSSDFVQKDIVKADANLKEVIKSTVTTIMPIKSAYGTWISEIMLQQTRVETVIPYWLKWMSRFPTISALASASGDEVNAMWAGLGYYRRAQQLLKGAQKVIKDFDGIIPETVAELRTIDGVGPYTAGAISSIAFGRVEPLVDGNVIRVLSRLYALKEVVGSSAMEKVSWSIAAQLVDPGSPGDFNQALMELGATKCKPISPNCSDCPVRSLCRAKILIDQAALKSNNSEEKSEQTGSDTILEDEINCTDPDKNSKNKNNLGKSKKKIKIEYDGTENLKAKKEEPNIGLGAEGFPLSISYFPQKMKKKEAKDVLVSVSVLTRTRALNSGNKKEKSSVEFLFIRRPNTGGLLANQWEFPNVIISDDQAGEGYSNVNNAKQSSKSEKRIPKSGYKSPFEDDINEGEGSESAPYRRMSQDTLWEPMPSFLRRTLGVIWESFPEGVTKTDPDVPSSSSSILDKRKSRTKIDEVGNKRKKGSGVADASAAAAAANIDSVGGDECTAVIKVVATRPCIALSPLVHVFSHQRHTMHVTHSSISVHHRTETTAEFSSDLGPWIPGSDEVSSWNSFCGDLREIRWMTAQEIVKAGITSGCKKILAEVVKL